MLNTLVRMQITTRQLRDELTRLQLAAAVELFGPGVKNYPLNSVPFNDFCEQLIRQGFVKHAD